jgi:SAM-dependent methyltransferase
MTDTATTAPISDEQARLNEYWTWRGKSLPSGGLAIRNEHELRVWMDVLGPLLPPRPADVVDLGTGHGFLALVLAAFGHRVRGFDPAQGQLDRANELSAGSTNPPVFALGDAVEPRLEAASVDVVANRNILWTLIDPARAFGNWYTILRPGGRLIAFHGVNNEGVSTQPPPQQVKTDIAYTEAVKNRLLPIRRLPTVEPALPLLRDAGFVDINVTRLESIERFELELDKHERTYLMITAKRPLEERI